MRFTNSPRLIQLRATSIRFSLNILSISSRYYPLLFFTQHFWVESMFFNIISAHHIIILRAQPAAFLTTSLLMRKVQIRQVFSLSFRNGNHFYALNFVLIFMQWKPLLLLNHYNLHLLFSWLFISVMLKFKSHFFPKNSTLLSVFRKFSEFLVF